MAHLDSLALVQASLDFGIDLGTKAHAIVFSQRRLLWAFDPLDETPRWQPGLQDYARYAMRFLQSNYPQTIASEDPDAAKGRLWLAPNHLSSEVSIKRTSEKHPLKVCVSIAEDHESANPLLVALHSQDRSMIRRTQWARSDEHGCISLRGARDLASLRAEVFEPLQASWMTSIDTTIADSISYIDIHPKRTNTQEVIGNEIVASLPCEGCEAIFVGLPSELTSSARIAPKSEPREKFLLTGVVTNRAGIPQAGVVVYAYQTDASGHYPTDSLHPGAASHHGRLRSWARTDFAGRYTFHTIRPGPYPGRTTPQHIHMHILEPGRCTYYLGDLMFTDDPRLTDALRTRELNAIGGSGIAQLDGDERRGWRATRDIVLGLNLPTYEKCRSRND